MEPLPQPDSSDRRYWKQITATNYAFLYDEFDKDLADWEKYEAQRQQYLADQQQIKKNQQQLDSSAAQLAKEKSAFEAQLAVMQAEQAAQLKEFERQSARDQKRRNPNRPQDAQPKGSGMVSGGWGDAGATMLTSAPSAAPTALSLVMSNLLGK